LFGPDAPPPTRPDICNTNQSIDTDPQLQKSKTYQDYLRRLRKTYCKSEMTSQEGHGKADEKIVLGYEKP